MTWSRILLFVLLVQPLWAESLIALRPDGTEIEYYLDLPKADRFPIAVILQGSECLRVSDKFGEWVAALNQADVGVLRLEKPGLRADTPIGECPEEYLRLNTIDRRVLDLVTVLSAVRRQTPGWDGRLGLAGGSEGSMVAAISAPLIPETVALLLISSGGGEEFGDEVKASIASQMKASGATPTQISEHFAEIDAVWEEIVRSPVPAKEWASDGRLGRNTYLWWANALRQAVYRPLMEVDVPIRVYQGKRDASMVESTTQRLQERFEQAGRGNLEIVMYDGEHVPPPEILKEAFQWLAAQVKK